jgi:hypothetical protein
MKKDKNFEITMPELQKIIKEEYANMAKDNARAEEIKARIETINEELKDLPETETLEEVEASGKKKVSSTGWTGEGEGDVKYGEKFEKIGTHLKEDEELEGEIEVGGEEDSLGDEEEIVVDASDDMEMGYFEKMFAELGKELDSKMDGEEEGDIDETVAQEAVAEEVVAEEDVEEGAEVVSEDLEEPIEGESPSQDSDARFNDYMEKDKHVNESVKGGTTLLSEGFTPERKTALDSELSRMKALAKINK